MGLPSNNATFLCRAYLPVIVLYRFKLFILSLAIATAMFSFYIEEGRAYSEYNLSANSEIKKSLANKKRKKHSNSNTSLKAMLFEKITVRKRNNVNLKFGFFSGSVVEYPDTFFQNQVTSDDETPRIIHCVKPVLSRSPPFFSLLTAFSYM